MCWVHRESIGISGKASVIYTTKKGTYIDDKRSNNSCFYMSCLTFCLFNFITHSCLFLSRLLHLALVLQGMNYI